jgi:triosephosphate isomerase
MSTKIAKALIGGNWKCNGTVASVQSMADVLNKGGLFSANSEVVIAAPSIHLLSLKSILRPDISVAAEVSGNAIIIVRCFYYADILIT